MSNVNAFHLSRLHSTPVPVPKLEDKAAGAVRSGTRLVLPLRRPRAPKEIVEHVADVTRAFKIREMPTVLERDQLRVGDCPRDVFGDLARDEIVIAKDDQGRNLEVRAV